MVSYFWLYLVLWPSLLANRNTILNYFTKGKLLPSLPKMACQFVIGYGKVYTHTDGGCTNIHMHQWMNARTILAMPKACMALPCVLKVTIAIKTILM